MEILQKKSAELTQMIRLCRNVVLCASFRMQLRNLLLRSNRHFCICGPWGFKILRWYSRQRDSAGILETCHRARNVIRPYLQEGLTSRIFLFYVSIGADNPERATEEVSTARLSTAEVHRIESWFTRKVSWFLFFFSSDWFIMIHPLWRMEKDE
jgi:hypothetical protein